MNTALYLLASLLLIICAFVVLLVFSALCVDKDKVYEKKQHFEIRKQKLKMLIGLWRT